MGVRTDLWWNSVDWKDEINLLNEVIGNTKITVVQPTAIVGYLFLINEHWVITPTLALGGEINVVSKGEPTGQGVIFLWGITFRIQDYGFNNLESIILNPKSNLESFSSVFC